MLILELGKIVNVVIAAKVFNVTRIATAFPHNVARCWAYENNSGAKQFFPKFGTVIQSFSQSSWGCRSQGTGDVIAAVPLPVGGQWQPLLVGTHVGSVG
jgi:hypothetical protein